MHEHGGMERATAELIRCARQTMDVTVISNVLEAPLGDDLRWVPVRRVAGPFPLRFLAFWFVAGARLRRLRADVVLTVGAIVPNRVDVVAVHFCHAGYRAALRGTPPADSPIRRVNHAVTSLLSLAAERWCYRPGRCRVLTAVSEGLAEELRRAYAGVRVEVVPNGVDCERFAPDPAVRETVRQREGIGDDDVVCLLVGGNWERKGLSIVVDAIAMLPPTVRDGVRLWVVGTGDPGPYERRARASGIDDAVRFFGHYDDVRPFLRAGDIFVLPSQYEAFSLAVMEAAASGLPVVTTPVNGAREATAGGGGIVVPRTPTAVRDAIADLAEDPALRLSMGRKARERMLGYSWSASVARTTAECLAVAADKALTAQ